MKLLQRWQALCQEKYDIQSLDAINHAFNQFSSYYAMRSRQYHNLNHISQCLDIQEDIKNTCPNLTAAIFLHDVFYNPRSTTNEQDSAAFARDLLTALGVSEENIQQVFALILATDYSLVLEDESLQIIRDIDLAVLGLPDMQYRMYARQIRKEFNFVPKQTYNPARAQVLNNFLDLDDIYQDSKIKQQYEHQARLNLLNEIESLT